MEISKDSFVYKLFQQCLLLMEEFGLENYSYRFIDGTNLCHLVRTIVLYTPLIVLLQLCFVVVPFIALIWLPRHLFGNAGWAYTLEIVFGSAAAIALTIWMCNVVGDWKDRRYAEKCRRAYEENSEPPKPRRPSLILGWIKAKKEKICPMITWSQHEAN